MGLIGKLFESDRLGSDEQPKLDEARGVAAVGEDGLGRLISSELSCPKFSLRFDFDARTLRVRAGRGYLSDSRSGAKAVSDKRPFDVTVSIAGCFESDLELAIDPVTKALPYRDSHQRPVAVWDGATAYTAFQTVITGSGVHHAKTGWFKLTMSCSPRSPSEAEATSHSFRGRQIFSARLNRGERISGQSIWASPSAEFSAEFADALSSFVARMRAAAAELADRDNEALKQRLESDLREQEREAKLAAPIKAQAMLASSGLGPGARMKFGFHPLTGRIEWLIAIDGEGAALIHVVYFDGRGFDWEGPLKGAVANASETPGQQIWDGYWTLRFEHLFERFFGEPGMPVKATVLIGEAKEEVLEWERLVNRWSGATQVEAVK